MIKKQKKIIRILFISMILVLLCGCEKKKEVEEIKTVPKKAHQVSVSASIEEYTKMDEDERKESCENKYIEISGIVHKDGSFLLVI